MPCVSVCLPTYNGANYVGAAIDSILQQTFTDFEVIVVDDRSTDSTEEIVRAYGDPRIKVFVNRVRLGLPRNWNRCIELSSAKYISIFHQDDRMLPQNIDKKVAALDGNPGAAFVHSGFYVIDQLGSRIEEYRAVPEEYDSFLYSGREYFEKTLDGEIMICCPSVVARGEYYRDLGGFDSRLSYACDWEMWMRIALFADLVPLSEPLVEYRIHSGSASSKYANKASGMREELKAKEIVLGRYPGRIGRVEEKRRALHILYARKAVSSAYGHYYRRRYREAGQLLAFALATWPRILSRAGTLSLAGKLLLGQRGTEVVVAAKRYIVGRR